MHLLNLFIGILSAQAFAAPASFVEVSVLNDGCRGCVQRYKFVLDDRDSRLDEVHRMGRDEVWTRIYQGTLTSVTLPEDARLDMVYGPRATAANFLKISDYTMEDGERCAGLRLKSGRKLVLLGSVGTTVIDWDDELLDARLLSRSPKTAEGISYIFSLKGRQRQGTFLIVKSEGAQPYKISDHFQTSLSDDVVRHLYKAGGKVNLRKWFKDPTPQQMLEEWIRLLDDREPLLNMPSSENLVRQAIGEMLMREFPRLETLQSEDGEVKFQVARLLNALVLLWRGRESVTGQLIHRTLITRLEAEMNDRAKCELSLLSLKGRGSHALAYYRGEALRAMNYLQRRLYKY